MWRVNTSAVGEQRRLRQREGEEKKKEKDGDHHSAVCLWRHGER